MIKRFYSIFLFIFCLISINSYSQNKQGIYVDAKGVIRWKQNNKEAAFFGVNYTVPFAYGYRSHKVLGVDHEKAIQQDVYHMARLGFDAFRVHVWDTEISDSTGNLLENEHLRLFDFLIAELKKRQIKILITPIAFWGNGYPEKDEKTPSFATKYGKGPSVVKEEAIKAQENYLKQFFQHVNPYTGLTYLQDPDVIGTEINNEPQHSGPKEGAKDYVNRLAVAIRNTGWNKPVFYNISESPRYADAVANAKIDGVSFQWYPTGLVANQEAKGNFLPHVDKYAIPFDTIPAYKNKARMVYEFDAADVLQSYMYPAIAKSFRQAGFQWATQFAYDPMATAYANTEYQTHYLNLAYTPNKAVSLLIAGKAFHQLIRFKSYGTYPADSVFGNVRVSYESSLSEMNTSEEFYYSNSTLTNPVAIDKLKKIAGVGSSSVVNYKGTGAYFLDKLADGVWRLEVMPDALVIRDPFEKASLEKEVVRIQWEKQPMSVKIADLGSDFTIKAIDVNHSYTTSSQKGAFLIEPGTYLLTHKGKNDKKWNTQSNFENIKINEFAAPKPVKASIYLEHKPFSEISENQSFTIAATIVGANTKTKVSLYINSPVWKTIEMESSNIYNYSAVIPAEIVTPGILSYKIVVKNEDQYQVFPGNHNKDPFAWDNYINENWKTYIVPNNADLEIYNAAYDQKVNVYPSQWGSNIKAGYTLGPGSKEVLFSMASSQLKNEGILGFQHYFADKFDGRLKDLKTFNKVVIRARTIGNQTVQARLTIIDKKASSFAADITLTSELQDIEVTLSLFKSSSFLLLPRPYPGFMPLWFNANTSGNLSIKDIEKLQFTIGNLIKPDDFNKPVSFQIQSIFLKQ